MDQKLEHAEAERPSEEVADELLRIAAGIRVRTDPAALSSDHLYDSEDGLPG